MLGICPRARIVQYVSCRSDSSSRPVVSVCCMPDSQSCRWPRSTIFARSHLNGTLAKPCDVLFRRQKWILGIGKRFLHTTSCCDESVAIGGDMAAVDFEIFLLAYTQTVIIDPGAFVPRGCAEHDLPPCLSQPGFRRCMPAIDLAVVRSSRSRDEKAVAGSHKK